MVCTSLISSRSHSKYLHTQFTLRMQYTVIFTSALWMHVLEYMQAIHLLRSIHLATQLCRYSMRSCFSLRSLLLGCQGNSIVVQTYPWIPHEISLRINLQAITPWPASFHLPVRVECIVVSITPHLSLKCVIAPPPPLDLSQKLCGNSGGILFSAKFHSEHSGCRFVKAALENNARKVLESHLFNRRHH